MINKLYCLGECTEHTTAEYAKQAYLRKNQLLYILYIGINAIFTLRSTIDKNNYGVVSEILFKTVLDREFSNVTRHDLKVVNFNGTKVFIEVESFQIIIT